MNWLKPSEALEIWPDLSGEEAYKVARSLSSLMEIYRYYGMKESDIRLAMMVSNSWSLWVIANHFPIYVPNNLD